MRRCCSPQFACSCAGTTNVAQRRRCLHASFTETSLASRDFLVLLSTSRGWLLILFEEVTVDVDIDAK